MTDWFYATNGVESGPVSEVRLQELAEKGEISPETLVWNKTFTTGWKTLSEAGVVNAAKPPPLPPLPPPLPKSGKSTHDGSSSSIDEFIDAPAVQALVGPRSEYYRQVFRKILERAGGLPEGGNFVGGAAARSWNWPAALFTPGWLLYRRMYVTGAVVVVLIFASIFAPDFWTKAISFAQIGLAVTFGMYGNALYLQHVQRKWLSLGSPRELKVVSSEVGVDKIAPTAFYGSAIALVAATVFGMPGFVISSSSWAPPPDFLKKHVHLIYPSGPGPMGYTVQHLAAQCRGELYWEKSWEGEDKILICDFTDPLTHVRTLAKFLLRPLDDPRQVAIVGMSANDVSISRMEMEILASNVPREH